MWLVQLPVASGRASKLVGRVTPHSPDSSSAYSQAMNKRKCLLDGIIPVARPLPPGLRPNGIGTHEQHRPAQISIDEKSAAPRMYETKNDISQPRRLELNALMNQRLADAVDLQLQLKQAHWNVKGPSFIALHELFDQIDEAVESYVDMIAERIVQLGGIAEGTVRVAASRSRLEEYPLVIADGLAHVEAVARALSTFGREARSTINEAGELDDADTADLFTEISRGIDKWLWFVEAHSQAQK